MELSSRLVTGFSRKLAASFVIILTLLAGSAVVSIAQVALSSREREVVTREHVQDLIGAERLRSAVDATSSVKRGYLITRNAEFLARMQETEANLDRLLRDLRERYRVHDEDALMARVSTSTEDLERAYRRLVADVRNDRTADVVSRFEQEIVPRRRELDGHIDELLRATEGNLEQRFDEARASANRSVAISGAVLGAAILLSLGFASLVSNHLASAYRKESDAVRVAERALQARDELLRVVAHDLRSPLSAISMKVAVIRKTTQDERARTNAASVENITTRMDHLIKSLLDAAAIEAGRLSVSPARVDVAGLVDEVIEMLSPLACVKSIQIQAHVTPSHLCVTGDRDRLFQVLTNLVSNAIKFIPDGGEIRVIADAHTGEVHFAVSDTGPGLSADESRHVFDRFWKADAGGKKGSGLGLYIAKGIVEAHGGRIWVESVAGSGAAFYFTMPTGTSMDHEGLGVSTGARLREASFSDTRPEGRRWPTS